MTVYGEADVLREVAKVIDDARALSHKADTLWTAYPIASLDSVRNLRDDLDAAIARLEAVTL